MLNKEKYMDELLKYACRKPMNSGFAVLKVGGLADCITTSCGRCIFYNTDCTDCEERRRKWLEQEYVEQSIDWSKVPVDTPILVKDTEDDDWMNRYFAEYKNGTVYAWCNGATSWTENSKCDWKYAKLAESEE
mgnify:CR=1 FL=1